MEMVDAMTLIGLAGVTLVISVGSIFDPLRDWLKAFQIKANPLRILGELMACSMCAGWWVGFTWGLYHQAPIFESAVMGGLVSITSYALDEVFAIIESGTRVLLRGLRAPLAPQTVSRRPPAPPPESVSDVVTMVEGKDGPRPLTEEEAHVSVGGSAGE
jgi:hypothetical protein